MARWRIPTAKGCTNADDCLYLKQFVQWHLTNVQVIIDFSRDKKTKGEQRHTQSDNIYTDCPIEMNNCN